MQRSNLEQAEYVDISKFAALLGFKKPVMLTRDLHDRLLTPETSPGGGTEYLHRLGEMLYKVHKAIKIGRMGETRVSFDFYLEEHCLRKLIVSGIRLWCCREGKGYVIGYPEDSTLG